MRQMTLDEVKAEQLKILDYVADFCEQNGINYWIDSGTLLGAIRHKGYIPWDDDIDIGMLREDYDRFSEIFNQKDSKFKFVCIENTPDFYLPHGKVCNDSTVLFEPDENGNKLAVNIDVFVYDNAPYDENELKKMYDLRDKYRKIYAIKSGNALKSDSAFKGLLRSCRKTAYKLIFPNIDVKTMVKNSKKYSAEKLTRVGNFTAFSRMVCEKDVFDSFIKVEFEGKEYNAPIGYDKWLRSFYGDYMELPPLAERSSHHSYKAFYKEEKSQRQRY